MYGANTNDRDEHGGDNPLGWCVSTLGRRSERAMRAPGRYHPPVLVTALEAGSAWAIRRLNDADTDLETAQRSYAPGQRRARRRGAAADQLTGSVGLERQTDDQERSQVNPARSLQERARGRKKRRAALGTPGHDSGIGAARAAANEAETGHRGRGIQAVADAHRRAGRRSSRVPSRTPSSTVTGSPEAQSR